MNLNMFLEAMNLPSNLSIDEILESLIMYLRKSRKDMDYYKDEPIEKTLQRHEKILQDFIISIFGKPIPEHNIFREVASGDTIADRPVMQHVLSIIESDNKKGVICVEVERLARGNTIDQGVIVQTFQYTNTKIVTPQKIFNLDNDYDRSFFEDGLHQARKYLEYTKKILARGRLSSVNEGKFVGSICPYGYDKEKLKGQKGYKLIINEEEAKVVKIIFNLASKGMGASNIANHLNKIGSNPRKSEVWVSASIRDIIHNPVYYGMIKWNSRKVVKTMKNGVICKTRPKQKDYTLVKGLHEPIIDEEQWQLANKNSKIKEGKSTKRGLSLQNPLAGLVECGYCHRTMQRRNYRSGHIDGLICPLPHCKNIGSHLYVVENSILNLLQTYLNEFEETLTTYQKEAPQQEYDTNNDELIIKEIEKTRNQLNKAFDLLEQGIYDNNTFLERSKSLKERIKDLEYEKEKYSTKSKQRKIEKIKDVIPKLKRVLNNYSTTLSAEERNNLLKSIINKVYYIKLVRGKGHEDEFELKIDIRL